VEPVDPLATQPEPEPPKPPKGRPQLRIVK
jgi:hypothetical protein